MDPQALDRFLAELRRTGRLARAIAASGLSKGGLFKRRARDPNGKLQAHWARRRVPRPMDDRMRRSIGEKIDAIERLWRWRETGKWMG